MRPSTTPLASMAGAFARGSVVMTILPREGTVASPAEHDDTPNCGASAPEAPGQPALESPPERSGEPEEPANDRGQDQRLGGTHPAGLYPLPEAEPTVHAGRARRVQRRAQRWLMRPAAIRPPRQGVVLTLERFAGAFLDPQEQERLGLDPVDQVQLRDAAGWLVCTEESE